ncbi:hypothetical protein ISR8_0008 [Streptococcus pyogenes]|nr:hypothetical protein ISR8_0008 [Streptococcus pyogenes]SDV93705.1 hypothetical protein ISR7_1000 [Streptococcus pyogenes]
MAHLIFVFSKLIKLRLLGLRAVSYLWRRLTLTQGLKTSDL